jgi:hypothetical protein
VSPKAKKLVKTSKSKKRKDYEASEMAVDMGLMLPVIDDPNRKRYLTNYFEPKPET